MMREILIYLLRFFSKRIVQKYKPDIVAVTGSVGKTSTKDAVYCVLSSKFCVRKTEGNYNTEIGVPFAIIGGKPSGRSIIRWIGFFIKAVALICMPFKGYPKILILELAADKPGDIEYFMRFIKPKVSIITSISPVHLEKFGKLSRIVVEKRKVVEALGKDGYGILNRDDERLRAIAEKTSVQLLWYGVLSPEVDVKAEEVKVIVKDNAIGLYGKLLYKGTATPLFIENVGALHHMYSVLAAISVGLVYGMTPLDAAQAAEQFRPAKGRFVLLSGVRNTVIIDDTYNAAPVSVNAALWSLKELPIGKRKIAVLGDMLELGSKEEEAHAAVGATVVKVGIDTLVTYGMRAKRIGQSAEELGFSKDDIYHFTTHKELISFLLAHLKPDDVVLVKASRAMNMEKVVEALR